MAERALDTLEERSEARARRLALASAIWAARGIDDLSGGRTVQAELRGLSLDAQCVGNESLALALDSAADALSCLAAVAGAEDPPHLGRKILVLDDSEVTADLVALALDGVGCVVAVATSLAEFLERFGEVNPDAVIIEPAHPDLTAAGGAERLLGRMERAVLPVIFFSAEPKESLRETAQTFHAAASLAKDQGLGAMLAEVEEILSEIIW